MKEKIMHLIIGALVGAVITTSGFLIYNKTTKRNQTEERNMNNMGEPPEKPDNNGISEMGEPPSRLDSDNSEMKEPPSKLDKNQFKDTSENGQSKLNTSEASNS